MHRGGASLGKLLMARRGQGRNTGSVPQRDHPQGAAEQRARRLREKRLLGKVTAICQRQQTGLGERMLRECNLAWILEFRSAS